MKLAAGESPASVDSFAVDAPSSAKPDSEATRGNQERKLAVEEGLATAQFLCHLADSFIDRYERGDCFRQPFKFFYKLRRKLGLVKTLERF